MRKILTAAGVVLAATLLCNGGASAQAPQFTPRDENPEDFPAGPGRDDTTLWMNVADTAVPAGLVA